MLLTNYRGPKIDRLRPARSVDRHGDPVEDWTTPVRRRLFGASAQPVSSEEEDGTTTVLRDVRTLYVRGRPDLTAADRVEIAGDGVWRVDGNPEVRQPLSAGAYTVATLRRLSGGPS